MPPTQNNIEVGGNATGSQDDNITKALCKFIAEAKYDMLNTQHIAKLKDLIIDHIGIAAGAATIAESSDPFLKAILALQGGDQSQNNNSCTVYTKGKRFAPQYAGLLNAAYSHMFDFDDTHTESITHPGATAIPAALAEAESQANLKTSSGSDENDEKDGKRFLLAVAVGYEVTTRLGRALSYGGYHRGFHNTATAGIFGATAAIAKLRGASPAVIENAFGLALSRAAGSMQFQENGAWNKRLHPGFAVRDAFAVTALAEAGVLGSARPIEGSQGFLHLFSTCGSAGGLLDGLGSEWVFAATALKPFPACRMTHSAIEVVANVAAAARREDSSGAYYASLESITVELSSGAYPLVGLPRANKLRPVNIVDGQFSVYFQLAVAWLHGMDVGWAMYEKLGDEEVLDLCGNRVKVVENDELVHLGTRVTFRFADGTARTESQLHPLGEDEHPLSKERIQAKFLAVTRPCYSAETQRAILDVVGSIDSHGVVESLKLL